MKYETFCPLFPGFYGTVFEYEGETDDIESYNQEHGTNFDWDDFEWDYADYHERVCRKFVGKLESELKDILPIKIEYQSIHSPREYNFANDTINVEITVSLPRLIGLIKAKREEAAQYFKDHYTSCSGFISFHSPHVDLWLTKSYIMEKPAHRVGALLDCLCSLEGIDHDKTMYWAEDESWIDFGPKETVEQ